MELAPQSTTKSDIPTVRPKRTPTERRHDPRPLPAVRALRSRRAHLRVHLDPLPGALRRTRRIRTDRSARDLPGRHVRRGHGGESLGAPASGPAPGLCAGGVRRRLHRAHLPRCLRLDHRHRLSLHLPVTRGLRLAAGRQVDAGERVDPPAVGPARRHLPAHERRGPPAQPRPAGQNACPSLLLQQSGRGGRGADRRVLPGGAGRAARHPAHGGDAQPGRRCHDHRDRRSGPPAAARRRDRPSPAPRLGAHARRLADRAPAARRGLRHRGGLIPL